MANVSEDRFPPRHIGFQPSLDGIRGLAVLSVIGLHLGISDGGNGGVTLFFTLSGFLITGLLVEEQDTAGHINLPNFYIRRGLRLFPALLLVLAVDIVFVLLCRDGYERKAGLAAAAATLLYSSNWCLAYGLIPLRQLSHTWSLAVEEQFYLIWPLLVVLLLRLRWSRKQMVFLIGVCGLALTAERFLLAYTGASEARLYNGLDTRADGLLIGAVAALAFRHHMIDETSWLGRALGWCGAIAASVLVLHLFLGVGAVPRSTSGASLASHTAVAVLSAVVLLALMCDTKEMRLVHVILRWTPLQFIGKISYGLYLWHYVIFSIVQELDIPGTVWLVGFIKTIATLVVSVVSFHFIERPCLRFKERFARVA